MKIALSGKMGAGKNLFLDLLRELYPQHTFKELKFADKLYEITTLIQQTLKVPVEKDGKLLQFIGEHYRARSSRFWCEYFEPCDFSVVTDVRYPEELDTVEWAGYTTVRINRLEENRRPYFLGRNTNHRSETALDDTSTFDHIIENDGTIEEFKDKIKKLSLRSEFATFPL